MKNTQMLRATIATTVVAFAIVIGACGADTKSVTTGKPAATAPTATSTATATSKSSYVGSMKLDPINGPVGTRATVRGSGFAPNTTLTVKWQNVKGSWDVNADEGTFLGRKFTSEYVPMASVKTDDKGALEASFSVPAGFGWSHDVTLEQDGQIKNKASFTVAMEATATPSSGPVGTPITIKMVGIGTQNLENSWQLMYDDKYAGWLSSVTTEGNAIAQIAATGKPGPHIMQIVHGWSHVPYLNNQQSPRPDRPVFTFKFTVTDGPAVLPAPAQQQGLAAATRTAPADDGKPAIWTDLASAQVGTALVLQGRHLPNKQVDLKWYRVVGNRVGGQGWQETSTVIGQPQASADGTLTYKFAALDDLGGPHRIEAIVDGKVVATTSFDVKPSAIAVENASGPAGTIATFHLKGVGWTETANIYAVLYDNAYIGFACGFNSQGDVQVFLPLTGDPGTHYVDFYPAIYKGTDMAGVDNFRIPQLTALADHPGEKLPSFRFAVQVTP